MLAIRARQITQRYGEVIALDGLDLDVHEGRLHGLVGPNGAGKTTLLGLLLGLAAVDTGTLDILGTRVGRAHLIPPGVSGFVDGPGLYPSLTARRNLAALTRLRGDGPTEVDEVLDQVGLLDVADDRIDGFSLGMRQRLGLAAALLMNPRLLVLDEPANGLDPAGKRHVHGVLTRLAEAGTTVVLSSHRMEDVEALCSEVTILANGRAVFSGALSELAAGRQVVDYRLLASDNLAARTVAAGFRGFTLLPDLAASGDSAPLVVRASADALHEFQLRLVGEGITVRELTPVVPPLEAAYLALTERQVAVR